MNLNPTKKELKKFGLVFSLILLAIGLLNMHKGRVNVFFYLGAASLLALGLAVFYPGGIKPFYFVITRVGRLIGWINTRVLLILVYYLILTPTGLIFRIFNRNFLARSFDQDCRSYWLPKVMPLSKDSYQKQY